VKIVCLESPFKPSDADVAKYEGRYSRAELLRQNLVYARMLLLNSLLQGETPVASHLLYTQVWSEKPELREAGIKAGIKAGIELHKRADMVALGVDLGISSGMRLAADHAALIGVAQTRRVILDVSSGSDPRELLAEMDLTGFPYLEELQAEEYKAKRNGKAGA
jgi:hypothetical protein